MLNNVQNSRNLGKIKRCSKTGPKGSYIFCTGSTLREAAERWTVKFSVILPQLEIICTVPPSKPFGFPACFFSYRTELSCRKRCSGSFFSYQLDSSFHRLSVSSVQLASFSYRSDFSWRNTSQASSFSCTGPTSPWESFPGCRLLLVPARLFLTEYCSVLRLPLSFVPARLLLWKATLAASFSYRSDFSCRKRCSVCLLFSPSEPQSVTSCLRGSSAKAKGTVTLKQSMLAWSWGIGPLICWLRTAICHLRKVFKKK